MIKAKYNYTENQIWEIIESINPKKDELIIFHFNEVTDDVILTIGNDIEYILTEWDFCNIRDILKDLDINYEIED